MHAPFALRETVPCAGFEDNAAVSASPSGSVSFVNTPDAGTLSGVFLGVLYESLTATGGPSTAVTLIVTVAVLLLSDPSLARYVNVSEPVNPAVGVYVKPPFAFRFR